VNLSNYFFRTDSLVLISITCNLLALYFIHEIRETFDVKFMPEISLEQMYDSKFHEHQSMKLQLTYEIMFSYVQKLQKKTINIVRYNKFSKPQLGRAGPGRAGFKGYI